MSYTNFVCTKCGSTDHRVSGMKISGGKVTYGEATCLHCGSPSKPVTFSGSPQGFGVGVTDDKKEPK
jgi:hypothetical protein